MAHEAAKLALQRMKAEARLQQAAPAKPAPQAVTITVQVGGEPAAPAADEDKSDD